MAHVKFFFLRAVIDFPLLSKDGFIFRSLHILLACSERKNTIATLLFSFSLFKHGKKRRFVSLWFLLSNLFESVLKSKPLPRRFKHLTGVTCHDADTYCTGVKTACNKKVFIRQRTMDFTWGRWPLFLTIKTAKKPFLFFWCISCWCVQHLSSWQRTEKR